MSTTEEAIARLRAVLEPARTSTLDFNRLSKAGLVPVRGEDLRLLLDAISAPARQDVLTKDAIGAIETAAVDVLIAQADALVATSQPADASLLRNLADPIRNAIRSSISAAAQQDKVPSSIHAEPNAWQQCLRDALTLPKAIVPVDPDITLAELPFVRAAYDALGGSHVGVDEASSTLSRAADEAERQASILKPSGRSGDSEKWSRMAVVMGCLRTAAANAWRVDEGIRRPAH